MTRALALLQNYSINTLGQEQNFAGNKAPTQCMDAKYVPGGSLTFAACPAPSYMKRLVSVARPTAHCRGGCSVLLPFCGLA
jgi:hypothetical protein